MAPLLQAVNSRFASYVWSTWPSRQRQSQSHPESADVGEAWRTKVRWGQPKDRQKTEWMFSDTTLQRSIDRQPGHPVQVVWAAGEAWGLGGGGGIDGEVKGPGWDGTKNRFCTKWSGWGRDGAE